MAMSLDWSSAVAAPGNAETLTVTIRLIGDLGARWLESFDERARQFNDSDAGSRWTVRLSSNDRVVIAEGLSLGGETQLKEELGKLIVDVNADTDALTAKQRDEEQRAGEKRIRAEAEAEEMTRRLRGGS